jgi:hypothetical protein
LAPLALSQEFFHPVLQRVYASGAAALHYLNGGFFGFDEARDSAADSEAVETNIFSSVFRETTLKLGMLRGGESLIVHVNLTPTRKINDDTGRYSRA